MRAVALVLACLFLASLAPVSSAAAQPGCDETFSHPEACYVYDDLEYMRWCVKNLRRCVIGPI